MAQKAAKSLAVRNTARLKQTHLITLALHGIFILFSLLLRRSLRWTPYILLSAPGLATEFYLHRLSTPSYNAADGSLRRAGEDLDARGLTEYMWDIIYWTWINLLLVLAFGNRAWWLYLVVPAYSVYAAVGTARGVRGMLGGIAGAGGDGAAPGAEGEASSNRQKKIEKRGAQRVAVQR